MNLEKCAENDHFSDPKDEFINYRTKRTKKKVVRLQSGYAPHRCTSTRSSHQPRSVRKRGLPDLLSSMEIFISHCSITRLISSNSRRQTLTVYTTNGRSSTNPSSALFLNVYRRRDIANEDGESKKSVTTSKMHCIPFMSLYAIDCDISFFGHFLRYRTEIINAVRDQIKLERDQSKVTTSEGLDEGNKKFIIHAMIVHFDSSIHSTTSRNCTNTDNTE